VEDRRDRSLGKSGSPFPALVPTPVPPKVPGPIPWIPSQSTCVHGHTSRRESGAIHLGATDVSDVMEPSPRGVSRHPHLRLVRQPVRLLVGKPAVRLVGTADGRREFTQGGSQIRQAARANGLTLSANRVERLSEE